MEKLKVHLLVSAVISAALFFSGCESKKDKLSVYPDDLEFYIDDNEELFVEVSTSAKNWSASTSAKWIYIDEVADGFYVSAEHNPGATRERTGRITVKAGEVSSATVTVTQLTASSGIGGGGGDLKFSDIVKSNFSATGTPGFAAIPGPATWTGQLTPSSGTDQYYEINSWAGKTVKVWCDFIDGKIVIDRDTKVAEDGANQGYFRAVALDNAKMEYYMVTDDYFVNYNKANKTLDFSGTHKGFPVYVGIPGVSSQSGTTITGVFAELYSGAKLVLTPGSSSSQKSANVAEKSNGNFSWSNRITFEDLKKYKLKQ